MQESGSGSFLRSGVAALLSDSRCVQVNSASESTSLTTTISKEMSSNALDGDNFPSPKISCSKFYSTTRELFYVSYIYIFKFLFICMHTTPTFVGREIPPLYPKICMFVRSFHFPSIFSCLPSHVPLRSYLLLSFYIPSYSDRHMW